MSERNAVYRPLAADDTLLYVGVSKRFGQRWEQHARMQPWWPEVDHQTVRWFASREDAELAEKVAIRDEGANSQHPHLAMGEAGQGRRHRVLRRAQGEGTPTAVSDGT